MKLLDLIAEGEHQQQDFKYRISSVPKIARSVSAFANTDGGRLLVGVRDNGKVAGVRSEEEIYMIDAAATTHCSPNPICHMETVQHERCNVLIATIEPCDERPVKAKDEDGQMRAYIRVDDENIVASPIHLAIWRQERNDAGELQPFTPREQEHLRIIEECGEEGIALNRFCRLARIARPKAITLLARWVRYEVVTLRLVDHNWRICLG